MRTDAKNSQDEKHDLVNAIADFIRTGSGDFNELALDAAHFQASLSAALRRLWRGAGLDPDGIDSWTQIPALPTLAYKSLEVGVGKAETVFVSSGTSGQPSRHPHAHLDLYRAVIDAAFAASFPSFGGNPAMLSLVPDLDAAPQSSLAFMVDHLVTHCGSARSACAWGERGLRLGDLRSWLAQSQREGAPVVVLATSLSLAETLERLAKISLRFRLPPGSLVIHTGGRKTREREIDRGRLVALLGEHLGLGPDALVGEYGMTELTSHFYGRISDPSDAGLGATFSTPPWARVRILDPTDLAEVAAGDVGLIVVFDLANLSSSVHVLTQDLGVADPDGGFRILGRAQGAELRGCSLLTEQLAG